MPQNPTLTVSQAAHEIGVPATTLRRWTNRGQVPYLRTPSGQRRFTQAQLREIKSRILTVSEAASELGVSARTLRRWTDRGLISCSRTPGGQRRFTWEQIRQVQDQMQQTPRGGSRKDAA